MGNGHMGNGVIAYMGMGYREYRPHLQWDTGCGYKGYGSHRHWDTWAMGHRGYGPHRQWDTWAMGYRGMRHMGNQVQGVWAP